MSNENPADNIDPAANESTDRAPDKQPTDAGAVGYEDINFRNQAGFKPMIGIFALILISFFLLVGLPMYSEPGDGTLTLFTYTSVIWGIVIIVGGFVYEYWLTKTEGGGW